MFQWLPWYFPLNATKYFRYFPVNALIFSIECREIFSMCFPEIFSMCFPEDLHFYMKKAHLLSKNAHFFNALFWINFHWGAQNGWKSWKTMFYVFCLFTPLYRRFRLSRVSQRIDLDEIYRLVSKILNFMPCGSVFDRFCVRWKNIVESPSKILLFSNVGEAIAGRAQVNSLPHVRVFGILLGRRRAIKHSAWHHT